MTDKEQLKQAIADWRKAAEWANPSLAKLCLDTATALEIELETGIPVCICHFIPMDDCRAAKKLMI